MKQNGGTTRRNPMPQLPSMWRCFLVWVWGCHAMAAENNVTSKQTYPPEPNATARPTAKRPTLTPWSANVSRPPNSKPPSASPSPVPSSLAPTLSCHDDTFYRSPINSLECSDHQGTNCLHWRYLGLNASEVERLVFACPVSCRIPCGAFVPFEIRVSFLVMHVANYLSPTSDAVMEKAGIEYLTNYAQLQSPELELNIYEGELVSQQMLSNPADTSGSRTDSRNRTIVNLIVTVEFRGYGINVMAENATIAIVQGLDSPGYTKAIQRSGDPELVDVEVTTNLERGIFNNTQIIIKEQSPPMSNGSTIAATVIVAALVVGAVVMGVLWYRRLGRLPVLPGLNKRNDSSNNIEQSLSQHSPLSPAISFESIVQKVSFQRRPGLDAAVTKSFDKVNQDEHQKGMSSSVASTDSEEAEHPYSGIIPAMIVIDNLEGEEENVSAKGRSVFPSKRVQASMALLSALRSRATDPTSNRQDLYHDETVEASPAKKQSRFRKEKVLRPPVTKTLAAHRVTPKGRKTDATIIIQQVDVDDRLDATSSGLVSSLEIESPLSRRSDSPKEFPRVSNGTSPRDAESDNCQEIDFHQGRDRTFSEASTVQAGPESPPEEAIVGDLPNSGGPTAASKDPEAVFLSLWARGLVRKGAGRSISADDEPRRTHSRHRRLGSRSSSETGSNFEPGEGEVEIALQAPRTGKLGLIIQCIEGVGPVVVHVKDYSPLLGQVQLGDRLVNIDGSRTTDMALSEITRMLPGRQMSRWATPVRLVVVRSSAEHPNLRDQNHSTLNGERRDGNHSPLMLSLAPDSNTQDNGMRSWQGS